MRLDRCGGAATGNGFSLVELIAALAAAGVLLAAAVPSFSALLVRQRVTSHTNLLLTDLHLARSEAIKRNRDVVVCRSTDGRYCAPSAAPRSDWGGGRIVYVNLDQDRRRDPDEPLLQVRGALPDGLRLRFNQWWRIIYHPDGGARNGSFTLCGAGHARALVIYYTGRPRIANRQANGAALSCEPSPGA